MRLEEKWVQGLGGAEQLGERLEEKRVSLIHPQGTMLCAKLSGGACTLDPHEWGGGGRGTNAQYRLHLRINIA